jgi:hypothetical protein
VTGVLELATSGRAKCRGCGRKIAKDEPRLGEVLPNPFADDSEMTLWFHPRCAAFKRPEPLLEALRNTAIAVERADWLASEAERSLAHRRLPRIDGAQRASSGRAACRSCKEPIAKDTWRIKLAYFEDGRFDPGGFVHASCATSYFETTDLIERVACFSPELGADELAELRAATT